MTLSQPRIMVVDDDPGMLFTLTGILEDEGFDVHGASDGYQAIRLAKEYDFDLIFMDIKMPGIDGVQTYREIRKDGPPPVVVMMTGYSLEEMIKDAFREGVYAVLHKPFEVEKMMDIIRRVVSTVRDNVYQGPGEYVGGPTPGVSRDEPITD